MQKINFKELEDKTIGELSFLKKRVAELEYELQKKCRLIHYFDNETELNEFAGKLMKLKGGNDDDRN